MKKLILVFSFLFIFSVQLFLNNNLYYLIKLASSVTPFAIISLLIIYMINYFFNSIKNKKENTLENKTKLNIFNKKNNWILNIFIFIIYFINSIFYKNYNIVIDDYSINSFIETKNEILNLYGFTILAGLLFLIKIFIDLRTKRENTTKINKIINIILFIFLIFVFLIQFKTIFVVNPGFSPDIRSAI